MPGNEQLTLDLSPQSHEHERKPDKDEQEFRATYLQEVRDNRAENTRLFRSDPPNPVSAAAIKRFLKGSATPEVQPAQTDYIRPSPEFVDEEMRKMRELLRKPEH